MQDSRPSVPLDNQKGEEKLDKSINEGLKRAPFVQIISQEDPLQLYKPLRLQNTHLTDAKQLSSQHKVWQKAHFREFLDFWPPYSTVHCTVQ